MLMTLTGLVLLSWSVVLLLLLLLLLLPVLL